MAQVTESQAFELLLLSLSSSDKSVRIQAEKAYETMKINDNVLSLKLLHCIGLVSLPNHLRQMSTVLLRRLFLDDPNALEKLDIKA